MGAKHWAKSGSTPDWMDVMAAIRAVDGIHLGRTMVTIFPAGIGSSGGSCIVISTCWDQLPGEQEVKVITTERTWVGHTNDALPAFVLGGIYAHDFALGEAYQQRHLPE